MSRDRKAEIASYIGHFREQHHKVAFVKERLHRKILAVTMISTLAEGRYTDLGLRKDKQKFISLIDHDSGWSNAQTVSVLHLKQVISKRGLGGLGHGFVHAVDDLYAKLHHDTRKTSSVAHDPPVSAMLSVATSERERELIEDAKHSVLLYLYRCKLVHEFREQGHPWEFEEDTEPLYRFGERVYPAKWLLGLVPVIIDSLETYYLSTGKDPRAGYDFGSPWT